MGFEKYPMAHYYHRFIGQNAVVVYSSLEIKTSNIESLSLGSHHLCWGSKNGGGCRSGRWEAEEKDPGGGGVRSPSWRPATSEFPRDNNVTVNRN
jgi:hypothetical protein